jgi:hypothetical protein
MHQPNLSALIWSVADLLRGDDKPAYYGKVRVSNSDNWMGGIEVPLHDWGADVRLGMMGTDQVGAGSNRQAVKTQSAAS